MPVITTPSVKYKVEIPDNINVAADLKNLKMPDVTIPDIKLPATEALKSLPEIDVDGMGDKVRGGVSSLKAQGTALIFGGTEPSCKHSGCPCRHVQRS